MIPFLLAPNPRQDSNLAERHAEALRTMRRTQLKAGFHGGYPL